MWWPAAEPLRGRMARTFQWKQHLQDTGVFVWRQIPVFLCQAVARARHSSPCRSSGRCSPWSSPRSQPHKLALWLQEESDCTAPHGSMAAPRRSSPWSSLAARPACPEFRGGGGEGDGNDTFELRIPQTRTDPELKTETLGTELWMSGHLWKCFSEFEACKKLSILGILGSNGNAGQHEAGDELEVHFDVKPGGGKTNVEC